MAEPYKHKLGELKEEHFDGDPIPQPATEARRKQADATFAKIKQKAGLPLNAVEQGLTTEEAPKGP